MPGMTTIRETHEVSARTGKGFEVEASDLLRITDLEGSQPVDFWAFSKADHLEFLSCEHTKPSIEKLFPHLGDSAYTNRRRRIVTVIDDTSPGQHDMQYAACDSTRYAELGVEGYHESCQENLHTALKASVSRSTSRRSPGTCSPISSSTPTAPSPSRHRNPGRATTSC